jgi:hypothetical protein
MIEYPNIEWGAFFTIKNMPTHSQLVEYFANSYRKGTKSVIYDLIIDELIVYPQTTSGVEVEYSPEYNHLMDDYKRVMFANKHPIGIIHSHHTMNVWHSGVDIATVDDRVSIGQKTISIVVGANLKNVNILKKYYKEDISDKEEDLIMNAITLDDMIIYPPTPNMKNFGISYAINDYIFPHITKNDIINAEDFQKRYHSMREEVKMLSPYLTRLQELKKDKIITEENYHLFKNILFKSSEARELFKYMYKYMKQAQSSFTSISDMKDELTNVVVDIEAILDTY